VLDRFERANDVSDVEVIGLSPDLGSSPAAGVDLAAALEGVDGVERAGVAAGFPLGITEDDYFMVYSSLDDSRYADMDRLLLDEGRMPAPDEPDEIAVNATAAAALDLELGDVVSGPTLTPEAVAASFTGGALAGFVGPSLELRVVGIITRGQDLPDRSTSASTEAIGSPAFAATYGDSVGSYVSQVGLVTDGTSEAFLRNVTDAARTEVGDFEIGVETTASTWGDATRDTNRTLALAVGAFTGLAALAGTLVVLQALSPEVQLASTHDPVARGLGMTRRARMAVATGPALLAITIGIVAGLAAAVLASGLFPIGRARKGEVDPGLHLDVVTMGTVTVLLALVLAAWTARASWRATSVSGQARLPRPSRLAGRAARLGAPPSAVVGVRMAFERNTGRATVPVRSAVLGSVVAVGAVMAVLVLAQSANAVADDPARFGWVWSTVPDNLSEDPEAAAYQAAELDDVAGIGLLGFSTVESRGVPLPAAALEALGGTLAVAVVDGRLPATGSEIALAHR